MIDGAIALFLVFAGFIGVGVIASRFIPVDPRWILVPLTVVYFTFTVQAWSVALWFNVVSFDNIARSLGIFDAQAWFRPFMWGPPIVGVFAFAISAMTRTARTRQRDGQ